RIGRLDPEDAGACVDERGGPGPLEGRRAVGVAQHAVDVETNRAERAAVGGLDADVEGLAGAAVEGETRIDRNGEVVVDRPGNSVADLDEARVARLTAVGRGDRQC